KLFFFDVFSAKNNNVNIFLMNYINILIILDLSYMLLECREFMINSLVWWRLQQGQCDFFACDVGMLYLSDGEWSGFDCYRTRRSAVKKSDCKRALSILRTLKNPQTQRECGFLRGFRMYPIHSE
ncbi:hypothetical protein FRJ04_06570, partial [Salmonella enterica]|nr:hypothetical protein [Salmonella enterica]